MKTLILHEPSELAKCGRHISNMGLDMAHGCGAYHYRNQEVHDVYTSSVQVTGQTLVAMMVNNPAFAKACRHPAVEGLGTEATLMLFYNDQFADLVAGGVSVMEAFVASHDIDLRHVFEEEAMLAIHEMFACMADGELAVGVFSGYFITLAAHLCGLRDLHSLDILEAVVFEFHGGNKIVAKRMLIS